MWCESRVENGTSGRLRQWGLLAMMRETGTKNANNNDWQFWQQNNQPIEMTTMKMFYDSMAYIHNNPVETGLVEREEDYLYSSARDFYSKRGLIELSYVV